MIMMIRRILSTSFAIGIIFCCCAASRSQPQSVPPLAPHRDSQALTVIQNAISALGGATNIGQAKDLKVIAQRQASAASSTPSGKIVWEAAGAEFKSDFPAAKGRSILTSGHGKPVRSVDGVSEPVAPYVVHAMFVPSLVGALLLRESQDPNRSFELLPQQPDNNAVTIIKTYSVVNQSDRVATEQTWYFDSGTGLPMRIEYRFPHPKNPNQFGTTSVDLSNFKPIENVLYPFQIVMSQLGLKMADVTVQSISVNTNLPPQDFDSPASLTGAGG